MPLFYLMNDNILWIHLHPPRTGGGSIIAVLLEKFPEGVFDASKARYKLDSKKLDKKKARFIVGHATYYGIQKLVPNKIPRYFIFLRNPAESLIDNYNIKMNSEKKIIPFEEWYKNQIKNELVHVLDLKFRGSESIRINVPKTFMPIIRKLNYKTFYFIQKILVNILGLNKKNDLKKLENAKKLLDLCWFVGILEKSEEDFKFLFDAIGLKNIKWKKSDDPYKEPQKINDELRQKIYKENPLDLKLYQYALKLNKEKRPVSKIERAPIHKE